MLLVYTILSLSMYLIPFNTKAIIYLIVIYILYMLAERFKAQRFVRTVLRNILNLALI